MSKQTYFKITIKFIMTVLSGSNKKVTVTVDVIELYIYNHNIKLDVGAN